MTTNSANKQRSTTKVKRKMSRRNKWLIGFSVAMFLGVFAAISIYLIVILAGEKLLQENIDRLRMDQATVIYDNQNRELTTVYRQNRELVKFNELPKRLIDAFVAVEDKRFYNHTGFDVQGIFRALYRDIIAGSAKEGGSTITQQLAKNMFLTSDKTLFRKVRELSLAMALENNYTKDQIIVMYLNSIYFGNGTYGVKAASKLFFDKSNLQDLDLWEMATLAAIPKAPTYFSPFNNAENSKGRRGVVLKLMMDQGYITQAEREAAAIVDYQMVAKPKQTNNEFTTYIDYVIDEVNEIYGIKEDELLRSGYKVYTALDRPTQLAMNEVFNDKQYFPKDGPRQMAQGAMVVINQETGGITAMIGGRNYVNKGLNRVRVQRQPGSAFKPIVSFAPALDAGQNPYERIPDVKKSFGNNTYFPKNYDGVYRGTVNMYDAIRLSINIPAVATLEKYGVSTGFNFAKKMGIKLNEADRNLSMALGGLTYGVTPLEMAQAYTAFANGGQMIESHTVLRIVDRAGVEINPFYSSKPRELKTTKVMQPSTADLMTQLLEAVVKNGTGKAARIGSRPVAGKTGTTQPNVKGINSGSRDAWFVGYTPEVTAAVWVGFDKTDKDHYLRGSSGISARIFSAVLSKGLSKRPIKPFERVTGGYDLNKYEKPKAVVTLSAKAIQDYSMRLDWTSTESGLNYRVYRKDPGTSGFAIIGETMDMFYVDREIEPAQAYEYYVEVIRPETSVVGEKSNVMKINTPTEDEFANMGMDDVVPDDGTNLDGAGGAPADEQPTDSNSTDTDETGGADGQGQSNGAPPINSSDSQSDGAGPPTD